MTERPWRLPSTRCSSATANAAAATSSSSSWLESTPPDVLAHRRAEAELLFRRIGITFAVYGEAEAEERIIPFDIIPRVLTKPEWERLARGLEQRVTRAQPVPRRRLWRRAKSSRPA